ncbi:MAG TPA: hypothetical protein VGR00_02525, partial [Thermoanaerobaculia bacterium]|nr:hypothetical protein [Thermoanaerobaculia bacterium]
MAEKDPFGNLRHSKEEEYFHKKERELIEKVRQRARLGEAAGVEDTTVLGHLEALGFDRDTVGLLHLVPLVQVAWSDGEVSAAERKEIHDAAAARGVAAGSPARAKLDGWLSKRPETA